MSCDPHHRTCLRYCPKEYSSQVLKKIEKKNISRVIPRKSVAYGRADRQTERQTDRETNRQTERRADAGNDNNPDLKVVGKNQHQWLFTLPKLIAFHWNNKKAMWFFYMVDVSSASPPTDSIVQANMYTVNDTICTELRCCTKWSWEPSYIESQCETIWKKRLVALRRSTIEQQQVSTSLSVDVMLPHPSMNDTPSYSEQNSVLPHPVHFFHVLIFHLRKQIIIWRMYGIIAEVVDHSLDHLDTWQLFAFSHTSQCLLPPIRSAILQDGVTRCYPIRFPTVLTVSTGYPL